MSGPRVVPFSLKLGYRDVDVVSMAPDHEADGLTILHRDYPHIGIRHGMPQQAQAEVLIHELVHALWDQQGISAKPTEEEVATKLGVGFATLIRDNPELLPRLQGAFHDLEAPVGKAV